MIYEELGIVFFVKLIQILCLQLNVKTTETLAPEARLVDK